MPLGTCTRGDQEVFLSLDIFQPRGGCFSPLHFLSLMFIIHSFKNIHCGEFPGDPMVRTWRFHCWDPGSVPGWRTKILHVVWCSQKKKKKDPLSLYSLDIIEDMILVVRLNCVLFTFEPQHLDLLQIVASSYKTSYEK